MALNSFIPAPNHPQPSLFGVLAQVSRALSNFVRPSAPSFFPGSIPQIHTKPPSPEGAKYPSTGCSPVFSFIRSFVHSFIRSFVHSFIRSFVHSFIRSSVHSFIRSFVHSFICSFVTTPAQPVLTRNIRAFVATPTRRGFCGLVRV